MNAALGSKTGSPSSSTYALADQRLMSAAVNYFAWQARLVKPEIGRRVLEVGCGSGNFTRMLLDRDAVLSLDCDSACVEWLLQRFSGHTNLQAAVCDAGDLRDFDEARRFQADSAVCLNVLEHIEDDRGALDAMSSMLPAGGTIALIVPAFESLTGPIDRHLGHYRRYRKESLRELASACGLEIKKLRYMNCVGFFGWWLNSHIFKLEAQSRGQISFFDRLVVPVLSRLEALIPPPFGQSLFVVLRKP
jgi:ubiquinone/menaquinone biosynthesis C-methylase UbiE